jgi:hypothetical protein
MRRIRELSAMNQDIENNSLIGNSNFKDCRPLEPQGSIFTNQTIAEHQKTTMRSAQSTIGGPSKKTVKVTDPGSLAISKTIHEKEHSRRALQEKHHSHVNKVQNLKHTIS